jgi:hypothetical protein
MRIKLTIMTLASVSSLVACAAGDLPDTGADPGTVVQAAVLPPGTPTLACNLEYEKFDPSFAVSPVASFQVPYSQVQTQGVAASDGHYQISVSVNPTPATNLSVNLVITNVQTAKDAAYLVLPPLQVLAGGYLFETGARISALTKNGVSFDHIRAYCTDTLAP